MDFSYTKDQREWWWNETKMSARNLLQVLLHRLTSQPYFCKCNSSVDGKASANKHTHPHKRINNLCEHASGNKTQTKSARCASQHKQTMAKSEKKINIILTSERVKLGFISQFLSSDPPSTLSMHRARYTNQPPSSLRYFFLLPFISAKAKIKINSEC